MREKIVQGTVELFGLAMIIIGLIVCMCETTSFKHQFLNACIGLDLMIIGAGIGLLLHNEEEI